jgi:hypothetical protein
MQLIFSLNEVEKKLRETADEFELSRQEAHKANNEFQSIKKERFSFFMVDLLDFIRHILVLQKISYVFNLHF